MRLSVSLLSVFALAIKAQDADPRIVQQAFEDANIPKDLSIKFEPTALLGVTFFESYGNAITLHAGQQLPRDSTAGPPTFQALDTPNCGPFVIAMIDPDAPTRQMPTFAEIRHFLGGNFNLDQYTGQLTNSTPAITEYLQPTPPAGSDAHRYIFLIWNQPPGFDQQTVVVPSTPIELFSISDFAREVGLGDPIAGTFMLVAPDETAYTLELI